MFSLSAISVSKKHLSYQAFSSSKENPAPLNDEGFNLIRQRDNFHNLWIEPLIKQFTGELLGFDLEQLQNKGALNFTSEPIKLIQ